MAAMQMVDVSRQVRFQMQDGYRCPYCKEKNKTESIHETFRDYDDETDRLWGTCEFCGKDFHLQGKKINRNAAIHAHTQCRCGRHFLFFHERDARMVRFTKRLGSPYVRCPYCRRKVLLLTPETLARYWLSVGLQLVRIYVTRQRRALRRALQGRV